MSDSARGETRGSVMTRSGERPVRPPPDPQGDRPLLVGLALALVFGLAAGTQYVAWRFAFHPTLGAPLLVVSAHTTRWLRATALLAAGTGLGATLVPRVRFLAIPSVVVAASAALGAAGPIYAPYQIFVWYAANAGVATAAPVFRVAWVVVVTAAVAASLAVMTLWRRRRRSRPADSHGSAHWGDGANLRGEQGLLLGRERQRLLRFSGEGHVLTVAPTRAGKGVSAVIPNLLDYPGSVLVTDPKGENYAVTATWREALGHTVHAFDPFGVVQGEAAYNPLDLIDAASAEAVDDARLLADMLVLPGAREGEQAFWNEEARGVLTGLILHVAANAPAEMRTLPHVRELLKIGRAHV